MESGRDTLKGKVVGGVIWNVATQIVAQVSRLAVGVVLARLLSPHQFGIAGMAMVFTNFLALFTDLALGSALIQRTDLTEEDRSTVFWVTVGVGLACTALAIGLSGVVANFFGQPQVGPLFAVLSLGFLLTALSSTQMALAARELAYRRLQTREIAAVIAGAIIGIIAAVAGLGAWAIVAQYLAFAAVSAALIWTLSPWRPRFLFSTASLRDLGGFGAKLFGSRLLAYINLNGDNLLIGRFLGGRALGIYSLAYNVMFTPMVRIGLPFQQVVFPAYSRLQSDHSRLGMAWLRSKRLSISLLAPGFLAFFVVAPDLVPVVFGQKWRDAIPVLQLLCIAGVGHTFVTLYRGHLLRLRRRPQLGRHRGCGRLRRREMAADPAGHVGHLPVFVLAPLTIAARLGGGGSSRCSGRRARFRTALPARQWRGSSLAAARHRARCRRSHLPRVGLDRCP
jgi:PST family polysaccharide transporter